jgi:thioredoxin reductase (NADPH)
VPALESLLGSGVFYGAAGAEASAMRDRDVYVVGAGNSAGQAIVHLANFARHVHVVAREPNLLDCMSRYLVDRVQGLPNVTVHLEATVSRLNGNGHLESVEARSADGRTVEVNTTALFLFIGADPNTSWLDGCVDLDRSGFVLTGTALPSMSADNDQWRAAGRGPFLLETSLPGVFAAGDVRSGSAKRVSSAVGEGAMAVSFVHAYIGRPV